VNETLLIVFVIVAIVELGLTHSRVTGKVRTVLVAMMLAAVTATHTTLLFSEPSFWTVALWLFGLFRLVNLMRLALARMQPTYLRSVVARSSRRLIALQSTVAAVVLGLTELGEVGLFIALATGLCLGLSLLVTILRSSRPSKLPEPVKSDPTKLPTITVAIPARNETEDLAFCIESLLKSDYPKLEILVLDDCSQDNTPEVIKSFAHAGVRFLDGEEPSEAWLPKNAACQKLLDEATGEYIIFCGVDVRFESSTIHRLLAVCDKNNLDMLGLLPSLPRGHGLSLLQLARYFWELGLPRRLFNRPPALSTAWMVNRKSLLKIGGFKSVRRSIMPERQFAWEFAKHGAYQFLGSTKPALINTFKSVADQRETSVRLRYPQLRKRPENVAFYMLMWLLAVVLPLATIPLVFIFELSVVLLVPAFLVPVSLTLANVLLYRLIAASKGWPAVYTALPVIVLDFASLLVSMWRYEFGEVEWKDRNVCLPIMHVLPKLSSQSAKHPL
jgi:glycosyltransferase involved in cell wall biosynthesis